MTDAFGTPDFETLTDYERLELIRDLIGDYGYIDGAHHKQWLIDQILRYTCGNSEYYADFLESAFENNWDEGIAP